MSLKEFIINSGYKVGSVKSRNLYTKLKNAGIRDVGHLIPLSIRDLSGIDGISDCVAKIFYKHLQKIRGNNLMTYEELMKRSEKIQYFPTGSLSLDNMMIHANGKMGWRTGSIVELCGLPGSFKTQLCMSAAVSCMSPNGLDRSVIYLDSQDFDLHRLNQISNNAGVTKKILSEKFFLGPMRTMDDIDVIINDLHTFIQKNDVGLLVVDSLSRVVSNHYPTAGRYFSNYYSRNDHLIRLFSILRTMANYYNIMVLYTTRMDRNIRGNPMEPEYQPFEKHFMGYFPSTMIILDKPVSREMDNMPLNRRDPRILNMEIKAGRATVIDSSYLPSKKGYFYVSEDGISYME